MYDETVKQLEDAYDLIRERKDASEAMKKAREMIDSMPNDHPGMGDLVGAFRYMSLCAMGENFRDDLEVKLKDCRESLGSTG